VVGYGRGVQGNEHLPKLLSSPRAGVGCATALASAKGGAPRALLACEQDRLAAAYREVQVFGGKALALPGR
jgi:hypothetical protein